MEILAYRTPVPANWPSGGSFVDRNPNMSYLVYGEDRQAALIDTCGEIGAVLRDIEKRELRVESLLLTHNHPDHTYALKRLLEEFPSLAIGVHCSSLKALAAAGVKRAFALEDGREIKIGEATITVIAAPGHTRDSLCFWDKKGDNLFTGDGIMGGGIGCCDYQNGGNRNIFYQTIVHLLKLLPLDTHIYPGHFSEHYLTPPPYELVSETITNSYLTNILAGNRKDFDRDLKIFSQEFETSDVLLLDIATLDQIWNLEKEIWIPDLQASRKVIEERLMQGHHILAIKEGETFAGMVAWCYSTFSIEEGPDAFPRSFRQFSNCTSCDVRIASAAFIYSLGVKPSFRRTGTGSLLLQGAFDQIREDGISQVFIDSRLPSYNGSVGHDQEKVPQIRAFREAIDRYLATGRLPTPDDWALHLDPAVGFYIKNGLTPWLILRDFINDAPSGNLRVICYINLDRDNAFD